VASGSISDDAVDCRLSRNDWKIVTTWHALNAYALYVRRVSTRREKFFYQGGRDKSRVICGP
jgi:hypothetical protein